MIPGDGSRHGGSTAASRSVREVVALMDLRAHP